MRFSITAWDELCSSWRSMRKRSFSVSALTRLVISSSSEILYLSASALMCYNRSSSSLSLRFSLWRVSCSRRLYSTSTSICRISSANLAISESFSAHYADKPLFVRSISLILSLSLATLCSSSLTWSLRLPFSASTCRNLSISTFTSSS